MTGTSLDAVESVYSDRCDIPQEKRVLNTAFISQSCLERVKSVNPEHGDIFTIHGKAAFLMKKKSQLKCIDKPRSMITCGLIDMCTFCPTLKSRFWYAQGM